MANEISIWIKPNIIVELIDRLNRALLCYSAVRIFLSV